MDFLLNRAALKANIHFVEESLSKVWTNEPAVLCFLLFFFSFNPVVIMSLKEDSAQVDPNIRHRRKRLNPAQLKQSHLF